MLETLDLLAAPTILPHSHLFITFSSTKQSIFDYSLFKLALIDIILEIDHEDEIVRHSLSSKVFPSDIYLDDSEGVNLTLLNTDEHLYHGFTKVPTGKLLRVEIAFSGARSEIAIDKTSLTLTDSFFSLFAHEDEKNPDELNIQRFAVSTELTLSKPITLKEGKLKGITIDIDKDASFHVEPFESADSDRVYAEFKPTFNVKELPKNNDFLSPINLRFFDFQNIDLSQDDGKLFIFGDPQEKLFISDVDISQADELWLDGQKVDSLDNVFGLYQIDLQGILSIDESGYHYQINKAYILDESNDKSKGYAYGRITKKRADSIEVSGGKIPLKADDYSHLGAQFFTRNFEGGFSELNENDWVQFTFEKDEIKSINPLNIQELNKPTTLLTYQTSLLVPNKNLLNITGTIKDTITLKEPLPCDEIVLTITKNAIDNCNTSTNIETIKLSSGINNVTLIISRQGTFDKIKENNEDIFIEEPNSIFFFTDKEILKALLEKLLDDDYFIVKITAEGEITKSEFTIKNNLTISLLSTQKKWEDIASNEDSDVETTPENSALRGPRKQILSNIIKGTSELLLKKISNNVFTRRKENKKIIKKSREANNRSNERIRFHNEVNRLIADVEGASSADLKALLTDVEAIEKRTRRTGMNTASSAVVEDAYSSKPNKKRTNKSNNTSPSSWITVYNPAYIEETNSIKTTNGRTISLTNATGNAEIDSDLVDMNTPEMKKTIEKVQRTNVNDPDFQKVLKEARAARASENLKTKSTSSPTYVTVESLGPPGKMTPLPRNTSIYTTVYVAEEGGSAPARPPKSQSVLNKAISGGVETKVSSTNPLIGDMENTSSAQTTLLKNQRFASDIEAYSNRHSASNLSDGGPVLRNSDTQRSKMLNVNFQESHMEITDRITTAESKKSAAQKTKLDVESLYQSKAQIAENKIRNKASTQEATGQTQTNKIQNSMGNIDTLEQTKVKNLGQIKFDPSKIGPSPTTTSKATSMPDTQQPPKVKPKIPISTPTPKQPSIKRYL